MASRRILFAVLLAFTACGVEVGSGRRITEARAIDAAFTRVSIHSGISAQVGIGPVAVSVTSDENLVPLMETFVDGETLVVRVRPGMVVSTGLGLRAAVVTPALQGLEATGGSHVVASATPALEFPANASGGSVVTLDGLDCSQLNLEASGGSRFTLSGAAISVRALASGASRIEADAVPAQQVTLEGSGGSQLFLRASRSATGNLSGGSQATITGNPATRQIHTSGGSEVTWVAE